LQFHLLGGRRAGVVVLNFRGDVGLVGDELAPGAVEVFRAPVSNCWMKCIQATVPAGSCACGTEKSSWPFSSGGMEKSVTVIA
jgi:hypothetical protein